MSGDTSELKAQIADLEGCDTEHLRRHWRRIMTKAYPSRLPRHLVVAMLAYRLQANEHGDLDQEHRQYLDAVSRTVTKDPKAAILNFSPERRGFKPGTVFVREHNGIQHRVLATNEGLLWGSQTFSSLSAAARAITGTNWNGRKFFGLPKAGE